MKRNIVAKFCNKFNKPKVEQSKMLYKRKEKHNKKVIDYSLALA
jgi:hypothetical protein